MTMGRTTTIMIIILNKHTMEYYNEVISKDSIE